MKNSWIPPVLLVVAVVAFAGATLVLIGSHATHKKTALQTPVLRIAEPPTHSTEVVCLSCAGTLPRLHRRSGPRPDDGAPVLSFGHSKVYVAYINGKELLYSYTIDDRLRTACTVVAGYETGKPYKDKDHHTMVIVTFVPPGEQESIQRQLGEKVHGPIEFDFPVSRFEPSF